MKKELKVIDLYRYNVYDPLQKIHPRGEELI